jgi:hypothetical protein
VRDGTASRMMAPEGQINMLIIEQSGARGSVCVLGCARDGLVTPLLRSRVDALLGDHVRTPGTSLRSVAVREGSELIGLLPLCLSRIGGRS